MTCSQPTIVTVTCINRNKVKLKTNTEISINYEFTLQSFTKLDFTGWGPPQFLVQLKLQLLRRHVDTTYQSSASKGIIYNILSCGQGP